MAGAPSSVTSGIPHSVRTTYVNCRCAALISTTSEAARVTAVVVESWHSFPFFTLLLIAALRGIPDEMHQAAAVDGATAIQRFWHITLPMLKVVIVAAVVLRVIGLVNSPDLLLILTSGGPGHATMVLSLYAFETAYRGFDFGYAGALAVIMLLLLMVFAWAYVRVSGVMARQ